MLHDVLHSAGRSLDRSVAMSEQLRLDRRLRPRRGFRVTVRDKEIVRWIGRLRMATAAQVAERFELGRAVAYARLSGLVRLQLLEHARIFHGTPGVYLTTRAGLAMVDLDLPPARVDLRTYAHDVELNSLIIGLERELGRDLVITERDMRACDTQLGQAPACEPRFGIPLSGGQGQLQLTPSGNQRLHFPDCAVGRADGRQLAVELERTAKGRARLRRILRSYVGARHIAAVRYYAAGDRVRDLVQSEVTAKQAHQLIQVREWPAGWLDQDGLSTAA